MSQLQIYIDVYLRFLHLVEEIDAVQMDANGQAMFEIIMSAWARKEPLRVKDAMSMGQLGSPATLHKRVRRLRKMGLIDAQTLGIDHRTKILVPTSKGLEYVQKLGRALILSVNF